MLFLNLPVKDLEVSRRFFSALGFGFVPTLSDESCLCVAVDRNVFVLLLVEERFRDFVVGEIAAPDTTEALVCLSASSREEVDDLLERAAAAGARPWKPKLDEGFMYGGSFQDPDGHVWELMFMEQPPPGWEESLDALGFTASPSAGTTGLAAIDQPCVVPAIQ